MGSFPPKPWLNPGGHKTEAEGVKVEWEPDKGKGGVQAGGG